MKIKWNEINKKKLTIKFIFLIKEINNLDNSNHKLKFF